MTECLGARNHGVATAPTTDRRAIGEKQTILWQCGRANLTNKNPDLSELSTFDLLQYLSLATTNQKLKSKKIYWYRTECVLYVHGTKQRREWCTVALEG